MGHRAMGWAVFGAVGLCMAAQLAAEDLDLSRSKSTDWLQEENGRERGARAVLAPTDDPKELSGTFRKSLGIRLSNEDAAHTVVLSMGVLPAGASLTLTQATIDRFRHLVELSALVTLPAKERAPKRAEPGAAKDGLGLLLPEDLVIAPAVRKVSKAAEAPPRPAALAGASGGNPAFFLPAGKLEAGTWWLRVKTTVKEGEQSSERPPLTDSFFVKDERPLKKGEKGRNTPEVGLERPNSPSATAGMGF